MQKALYAGSVPFKTESRRALSVAMSAKAVPSERERAGEGAAAAVTVAVTALQARLTSWRIFRCSHCCSSEEPNTRRWTGWLTSFLVMRIEDHRA